MCYTQTHTHTVVDNQTSSRDAGEGDAQSWQPHDKEKEVKGGRRGGREGEGAGAGAEAAV